MILIITNKRDGHVEAVSQHLDEAGAPWARINIEDFATNVEVDLSPALGAGALFIKDSRKQINFKNVGAVWYRKYEEVNTLVEPFLNQMYTHLYLFDNGGNESNGLTP